MSNRFFFELSNGHNYGYNITELHLQYLFFFLGLSLPGPLQYQNMWGLILATIICARGKAISFVYRSLPRKMPDHDFKASEQLVSHQVSRNLQKLTSVCFESSGKAHEHHKWCYFVASRSHVHQPCPLQVMCFLLMRATGLVEIINILSAVNESHIIIFGLDAHWRIQEFT